MLSINAIRTKWRKGHFLLISLCIHAVAFILLGMIVLSRAPEPRESVSVQLVKETSQARKLRRDILDTRRWMLDAGLSNIKHRVLSIKHPFYSSQAVTEDSPVFQYELSSPKEPKDVSLRMTQKPLVVPKTAMSKPVARSEIMPSHRESIFEIHEQLSKLPSSYISAIPSSVRDAASNSSILQNFLQIVSRRIEKSKRYPKWAMDAGLEGKVVIRFKILQNGTLGEDIQLIRSSGTDVLDNAAIAAIKDAAPFPSLPRSLNREWLFLELPMDFQLRGS